MTTWTNWAQTASAEVRPTTPSSVAQVQEAVAAAAAAGSRIKPIGAGHSFTAIGVTDGVQLRPEGLTGILAADSTTGLVTVAAGTRLHDLNAALWGHGLSMTNLGDIDVQTIAGAISTGTHGTGAKLGGIATQVRGLQLVTADGEVRDVAPGTDLFSAACVGLGALGVITAVTLQCEPAFALHARETPAPLDEVLGDLDNLVDGNDHFEFYWFPHTRATLTKRNNRRPVEAGLKPLGRIRHYVDDELLANTAFDAINKFTTRRPNLIPPAGWPAE